MIVYVLEEPARRTFVQEDGELRVNSATARTFPTAAEASAYAMQVFPENNLIVVPVDRMDPLEREAAMAERGVTAED